jgi:hypothetical protein
VARWQRRERLTENATGNSTPMVYGLTIRNLSKYPSTSTSQRLYHNYYNARHHDEQLLLFLPQDHAKVFYATRSFFQFEFCLQHTVKTVCDRCQPPRSRPKKIIHVIHTYIKLKLKFSPRGGGRHMGSLCGHVNSHTTVHPSIKPSSQPFSCLQ